MEWVKIGSLLEKSVISTVTPTFKLQNSDMADTGDVPVISQEKDFINGYTNNEDARLKNGPFIVFGDHTECLKFVNFSFVQGADGIKIFKTDPLKMNGRYLYYALCGCYNKTGFYERHFKLLKKTCIPDYALDYQQNIVSVLSVYDDLIENNNKRIKILEQMAQELYKEWFIRFRFPGYETAKFVDGIPENWEKCKLMNVIKESGSSEKAENRDKYNYYLPIDCIPNQSMVLKEVDYIENAESSLISYKKGDVLFGAMRPYFHKVILSPFDGLTRTTCFVLRAKNELYQKYLYMLLYQKESVNYATTVSVGSTMPYVRWKDFSRMWILRPTEDVIKKFNDYITPIFDILEQMYFVNTNLVKQRGLLLPRLMSGKLEIKGIPDA